MAQEPRESLGLTLVLPGFRAKTSLRCQALGSEEVVVPVPDFRELGSWARRLNFERSSSLARDAWKRRVVSAKKRTPSNPTTAESRPQTVGFHGGGHNMLWASEVTLWRARCRSLAHLGLKDRFRQLR